MPDDAPDPDDEGDLLEWLRHTRAAENPGFPRLVQTARRQRLILHHLIERRRTRGLSQEEVARRMGTKQPAVARIEKFQHEPHLTTLQRYAAAIGCEITLGLVDVVDAAAAPYDEGAAPQDITTAVDASDLGDVELTARALKLEAVKEEGSDRVLAVAHVELDGASAGRALSAATYVEVKAGDDAGVLYEKVHQPPTLVSLFGAPPDRWLSEFSLTEFPLAEDHNEGRLYLTVPD